LEEPPPDPPNEEPATEESPSEEPTPGQFTIREPISYSILCVLFSMVAALELPNGVNSY
jgi:hypothetical protein